MRLFILSIVLSIFFRIDLRAQITEEGVVTFNQNFEKQIRTRIKDVPAFVNVKNIQSVPFFVVNLGVEAVKDISSLMNIMVIDSSKSCAVLRDSNDRFVGTVIGANQMSYSFSQDSVGFLIKEIADHYSTHLFMFSVNPTDPNPTIGFFDKMEIHFLNRKMRILTQMEEVIIEQVGSVEKYQEILQEQMLKQRMRKKLEGIEEVKDFLRRSYRYRMNHRPSDTVKVLDLLLNEIKATSKVSLNQLALIKNGILSFVKSKYLAPSAELGVPFYGFNVESCIKSVLTEKQFFSFSKQFNIDLQIETWASNKLYTYLFFKGVPQEQISEEMVKEIF